MAKTSKSRKATKTKKDVAKPEEVAVEASEDQQASGEILEQSQEVEAQTPTEEAETKIEDEKTVDVSPDAEVSKDDQMAEARADDDSVGVSEAEIPPVELSDKLDESDADVTTEDSIQLEDPAIPVSVISEPTKPEPTPAAPAVEARSGGFIPTVMGGVIAAGIGFAASLYLFPEWGRSGQVADDTVPQLEALIAKHSKAIEALQDQSSDTASPELTDLRASQDDLSASVGSLIKRLEQAETNIEGLSTLASGSGADADALLALQKQITQQRTEIEAMLGQAQGVEAEARLAAQRAALGQIQIAVDTGSAFAAPMSDLKAAGVDVPQELSTNASDGVKSLAALQDSFPDLARDALKIARNTAGEDSGSQGVGALLRSALGARSLEPKDGNDADAVLSRAEAALKEDRLHDVLSELQALPEPALAVLTEWSGEVAQRLAVISALQTLNDNLN